MTHRLMTFVVARVLVLALVALGVAGWACGASESAASKLAANATFQGTVMMIADDQITLDRDGEQQRFHVPPGTMIVVNSAEADLEDIAPGYFASITASHAGRHLVASFIDATRQY